MDEYAGKWKSSIKEVFIFKKMLVTKSFKYLIVKHTVAHFSVIHWHSRELSSLLRRVVTHRKMS